MIGATSDIMNFKHAVGFLFLGTVLGLLPQMAPGWCQVTGVDNSSTRQLWLQVMSFVQIGLAGGYFFRRLFRYLAVVMEYSVMTSRSLDQFPEARGEAALVAQTISMGRTHRPALPDSIGAGAMLPIPVAAFESSLFDQRAA